MRSSRTDGVLLHPARPATFTDLMIAKQAASASGDAGGDIGHLWSTYSTVGAYRWEHVLSKEMGARGFMVGPEVLTLDGGRADSAAGAVAYSLNTTTFDLASLQVQHFDSGTPVYLGPDVSRQAFELWHVAPILESGWVRSESLSLFGLVWVCFVTLSERILMGVVHCIHRPNVAGSSMPSPSPISMRARALSLFLSPPPFSFGRTVRYGNIMLTCIIPIPMTRDNKGSAGRLEQVGACVSIQSLVRERSGHRCGHCWRAKRSCCASLCRCKET